MSSRRAFISFKSGFARYGHSITMVVNVVLLVPVYILGVGVPAFIARFTGKHFLASKGVSVNKVVDKKNTNETYWEALDLTTEQLDEYYKQF